MEKRIRSPNYPALSLREAIEKVTTLYKNLHTHSAPREVVAKAIGYNSLHGASATAISALHKYGLLDRQGDEVKVSDRALRILHPHSPQERIEAVKQAAAEPQLFAELAERFPGSTMPSEDLLRNYLLRKGFAPSAVSGVILAYRETIDLVAEQPGGHDSPVPSSPEVQQMLPHHNPAPGFVPPATVHLPEGNERLIARYDFEDGGHVRVVTAGDIDTEAALDMIETLIAIKRKELKSRTHRETRPATVKTGGDENYAEDDDDA